VFGPVEREDGGPDVPDDHVDLAGQPGARGLVVLRDARAWKECIGDDPDRLPERACGCVAAGRRCATDAGYGPL
jgi:hypothetical protein